MSSFSSSPSSLVDLALVAGAACLVQAGPLQQQAWAFGNTPPRAHTRTTRRVHTLRTEPSSPFPSPFLDQVQDTVHSVLENYKDTDNDDILQLPPQEREAVSIARNVQRRLQSLTRNGDCRRCWLQRRHCYCQTCPPIQPPANVKRLFVLMHHKEICLAVDTARLLLSSFPETCRLVVGGIGPDFQPSMAEMMQAIEKARCLVLFPTSDAKTIAELRVDQLRQNSHSSLRDDAHTSSCSAGDDDSDECSIIVIDGTWSQARKLHSRCIPSQQEGGPPRVKLSDESLALLSKNETDRSAQTLGHQLRRHPIQWKAISTVEATRLFFNDLTTDYNDGNAVSQYPSKRPWDVLSFYQQMADGATKRQLGPHR